MLGLLGTDPLLRPLASAAAGWRGQRVEKLTVGRLGALGRRVRKEGGQRVHNETRGCDKVGIAAEGTQNMVRKSWLTFGGVCWWVQFMS